MHHEVSNNDYLSGEDYDNLDTTQIPEQEFENISEDSYITQVKKPKKDKTKKYKRHKVNSGKFMMWEAATEDTKFPELMLEYIEEKKLYKVNSLKDKLRLWDEHKYFFLRNATILQVKYGTDILEDLYQDSYIIFDHLIQSYNPLYVVPEGEKLPNSEFKKLDLHRVDILDCANSQVHHFKFFPVKKFINYTIQMKMLDLAQRKYKRYYSKLDLFQNDEQTNEFQNNIQLQLAKVNERSVLVSNKSDKLSEIYEMTRRYLMNKISMLSQELDAKDLVFISLFFVNGYDEKQIAEQTKQSPKLIRKAINLFRSKLVKDKEFEMLKEKFLQTNEKLDEDDYNLM